jgi:hypothetical protein
VNARVETFEGLAAATKPPLQGKGVMNRRRFVIASAAGVPWEDIDAVAQAPPPKSHPIGYLGTTDAAGHA